MKYALLIFLHVYGGTSAVSLPVETKSLCEHNKKILVEKYPQKFLINVDVVDVICLQVGE